MQRITLSFIAVLAGSAVFLGAKTSAVEPDSVTFDGSVLTVPYVEVGELAYEVKLVPTTDALLEARGLCAKLLRNDETSGVVTCTVNTETR